MFQEKNAIDITKKKRTHWNTAFRMTPGDSRIIEMKIKTNYGNKTRGKK